MQDSYYDPHTNTYKMELIGALLKIHALILTYFDFFKKKIYFVGIKNSVFSRGYF